MFHGPFVLVYVLDFFFFEQARTMERFHETPTEGIQYKASRSAAPTNVKPRHETSETLSQPRYLRDAEKEADANRGAQAILDSYSSIFPSSSGSDGDEVPRPSMRTAAGSLHLSKISSAESFHSKLRSGATHPSVPTQENPSHDSLPSFVLRARAEVAKADYIRNHDEKRPPSYLQGQVAQPETTDSAPSHSDTARAVQRPSAPPAQARPSAPQAAPRSLRSKPKATKLSAADVKTLIDQAVQAALKTANHASDADSQAALRWTRYLRKARAARIQLAAAPAQGPADPLRQAQVAVLAKRVQEAQQLLSRIQAAKAAKAAAAPAAPAADDATSRVVAFQALQRQGLIPPAAGGAGSAGGPAARVSSQSEFADEEEHLQDQVDSIFGPTPGPAPAAAAPARPRRAARADGARAAPRAPRGRAAARAAAAQAASATKEAELKALNDQIDALVHKVRAKAPPAAARRPHPPAGLGAEQHARHVLRR